MVFSLRLTGSQGLGHLGCHPARARAGASNLRWRRHVIHSRLTVWLTRVARLRSRRASAAQWLVSVSTLSETTALFALGGQFGNAILMPLTFSGFP